MSCAIITSGLLVNRSEHRRTIGKPLPQADLSGPIPRCVIARENVTLLGILQAREQLSKNVR
jgi:hypothetical protein